MSIDRRPKNAAEGLFWDDMLKEGWDITKKGWPDYACYKDGRLILVEIKPRRSHNLKGRQAQIMQSLAAYGIECFKWTPGYGFRKIYPDTKKI